LYALGGRVQSLASNLGAAEVYDPASHAWTALPRLPTARGGIAAAALDGRVHVVGGEGPGGTFSENEAFDVAAGTWVTLAPLPTARHGLGVAQVGGAVYVIGGGPQPGLTVSAANEVFRN
jgi:N-acetylneuraminic acid mutarotase